MKLTPGIIIQNAEICPIDGRFEISLTVTVNNEKNFLFFSFDPELNCETFKKFCKTLRIPQGKTREVLNNFIKLNY